MGRRPLRPPFKFLKIWMGGADASTTFELGSYEKQDRESKRNCLKVFTERERTRKFFEGLLVGNWKNFEPAWVAQLASGKFSQL